MPRALLLLVAACAPPGGGGLVLPPDTDVVDSDVALGPVPGIARAADGWRRGELHAHTDHSPDGFDPVATLLDLAAATADPAFLAAHPEHVDHGLDFVAITDHDTEAAFDDPAVAASTVEVVRGVEWTFANEEANLWGTSARPRVDRDGDGLDSADLVAAVDAVHAAGGAFGINHPLIRTYPFPWDVPNADSVEVWNTAWALGVPAADVAVLDAWEVRHGAASPPFRRAVAERAHAAAGAALVLWEGMLARGAHPAVVGGSDHHVLFLPGLVTTWVRVAPGEDLATAIRAGRTFVSRSAAGPEVLLTVDGGEPGGEVPPGAATIEVTTARAPAGRLRVIRGAAVADDGDLADAPLGEVVLEEALDADGVAESWRVELALADGDWVYAVVDEPLVPAAAEEEHGDLLRGLAAAAGTVGVDLGALGGLLGEVMDGDAFVDPAACDPGDWRPAALQCVPADATAPGTFFVPDLLGRAFNALTVDGVPDGWTRGALTSAVVVRGPG